MKFGKRSRANLDTCHPDLVRLMEKVLSYEVMDFSVIEGHRSPERQQELYRQGRSQIDGVSKLGMHNHNPSLAVDILPYPSVVNGVNVWNDNQRFSVLAGLVFAAASDLGIKVRWGGDWDGDGNNADSNFHDLPHFEIIN